MKNNNTPLVDDHLLSLQGMQEAGTDEFFYTRLQARMEREQETTIWQFPLRPVWLIGTLVLLLAVNGFMLTQQVKRNGNTGSTNGSSIQNFAQGYDQSISSY